MHLFDRLPDRIFRPLASKNRYFYAALLLHLYEHVFAFLGETPRLNKLLDDIDDFVEKAGSMDLVYEPEFSDTNPTPPTIPKHGERRRSDIYDYLEEAGWFVEMRNRYRKLVDLSPEGRMLLRELHRIATGDMRSYGGAVLNVLGNLTGAFEHPDERSEGIRNAYRFSEEFVQHLRTLSVQMHRLEEAIIGQPNLKGFFGAFFNDYVSKHIITDYKTLRTSNNPFRLRTKILDIIRRVEGNELLMGVLAAAYVREGRAADVKAALETIARELAGIHSTFEYVDHHLDAITETDTRIRDRVSTVIKYMDREDSGTLGAAMKALTSLGTSPLRPDAIVDVDSRIIRLDPPIYEGALYHPRLPRKPIGRSTLRQVEKDPAEEAFDAAKKEFALRMYVTPGKVRDFLETIMEGRTSIRASEINITGVDEFAVFQRIREADLMSNGVLARQFRIERLPGHAENEWLGYSDFIVYRVSAEEAE